MEDYTQLKSLFDKNGYFWILQCLSILCRERADTLDASKREYVHSRLWRNRATNVDNIFDTEV